MNQKDNLQMVWSEFESSITKYMSGSLECPDFSDVTLVCEEGQQVQAHRVIISASSRWFEQVLKALRSNPHPLVYMRGVKKDDLDAVVNFIYNGETQIQKQSLDSFLQLARDLELRGLEWDQRAGEIKETKLYNMVTNDSELNRSNSIPDIGNDVAKGEIKEQFGSDINMPFLTLEEMKINMQQLFKFETRIEAVKGMPPEEEIQHEDMSVKKCQTGDDIIFETVDDQESNEERQTKMEDKDRIRNGGIVSNLIWKRFKRLENGNAECIFCFKKLKYLNYLSISSSSNITGIKRHIKSQHKAEYEVFETEMEEIRSQCTRSR